MRNSNILDDIKELEKNVFEIKSTQPMQGDSLILFQSDSGLNYDWSGLINHAGGDPGAGYRIVRITFTAPVDITLFCDLIFEARIGSPTATPFTAIDEVDVSKGTRFKYYILGADMDNLNVKSFDLAINTIYKTDIFYLKFYCIGNADVTVSAVTQW